MFEKIKEKLASWNIRPPDWYHLCGSFFLAMYALMVAAGVGLTFVMIAWLLVTYPLLIIPTIIFLGIWATLYRNAMRKKP